MEDLVLAEELTLKSSFQHLCHFWTMAHWPINKGREIVERTTRIPSATTEYCPHFIDDNGTATTDGIAKILIPGIWNSFVREVRRFCV